MTSVIFFLAPKWHEAEDCLSLDAPNVAAALLSGLHPHMAPLRPGRRAGPFHGRKLLLRKTEGRFWGFYSSFLWMKECRLGKNHTQCPGFNLFWSQGNGFCWMDSSFVDGISLPFSSWHEVAWMWFSSNKNDEKIVPKRIKPTNFGEFQTRRKRIDIFSNPAWSSGWRHMPCCLRPKLREDFLRVFGGSKVPSTIRKRTPGTIDSRVSILVDFFLTGKVGLGS